MRTLLTKPGFLFQAKGLMLKWTQLSRIKTLLWLHDPEKEVPVTTITNVRGNPLLLRRWLDSQRRDTWLLWARLFISTMASTKANETLTQPSHHSRVYYLGVLCHMPWSDLFLLDLGFLCAIMSDRWCKYSHTNQNYLFVDTSQSRHHLKHWHHYSTVHWMSRF